MNTINQFLPLLAVHFLADFVLQSHWMASHKSRDNVALAVHVAVYSIVLLMATPLIFWKASPSQWLIFAGFNCMLHFVTDYITSRASSRLWAKQDWHNFFVIIGIDQLIHQTTLAVTMALIFGGG